MQAIDIIESHGRPTLSLTENTPRPTPAPHEILIRIDTTALNRADIFQKQGKYPPPEGASPILGLECSGEIVEIGSNVTNWQAGDKVCALLEGGGYAEHATVAATQALPIPRGWTIEEAGTLPEALFTVWLALFHTANLQAGDKLLVHGGASGIGSMAIQMATAAGAEVTITAGTDEKCDFCQKLGATKTINYRTETLRDVLEPNQFDVILDIVGASLMQTNLKLLAPYGKLISLAFLSGAKTELNMAPLLFKQASWHGLTLRSRTTQQKAQLAAEIMQTCWPWLEDAKIKPVIDSQYALKDAEKAHHRMEQNLNLGKIALKVAHLL